MSRSFNTLPACKQAAELSNIPHEGVKLNVLGEMLADDTRTQNWRMVSYRPTGIRKTLQRQVTTQRRARDRRLLRLAKFDPNIDIIPIRGDRKTVDWLMQ